MRYMLIVDEADRTLVEEELADAIDRLREDGDAGRDRCADRLEALRFVEVPPTTPQDADQASEALSRSREEVMPLMAQIIQASMSQTAATQQAVIDGLQQEVDQLQASLILIRSEVEELYSHPWNPRSFHVLGALYPDRYAIEQAAMKLAAQRERRYDKEC